MSLVLRIARRAVARFAPPAALRNRSDWSSLTNRPAPSIQARSAAEPGGGGWAPVGAPQPPRPVAAAAVARVAAAHRSARGAPGARLPTAATVAHGPPRRRTTWRSGGAVPAAVRAVAADDGVHRPGHRVERVRLG